MKVLLDECVPWPMHKLLVGHECTTAQQRGWGFRFVVTFLFPK